MSPQDKTPPALNRDSKTLLLINLAITLIWLCVEHLSVMAV